MNLRAEMLTEAIRRLPPCTGREPYAQVAVPLLRRQPVTDGIPSVSVALQTITFKAEQFSVDWPHGFSWWEWMLDL